jgi:DNA-binding MurR/RpiR family transcriptional regulator
MDQILIHDRVRACAGRLTPGEARVAELLLVGALMPGLQSVHRLAEEAGLSAPTVLRLVRKLGFPGYAAFQGAIRAELSDRMKPPLAKLPADAPSTQGHPAGRFAEAAARNLALTLDRLDPGAYGAAAAMLADPAARVHLLGGRLTRACALHFATHLQLIRAGVAMIDPAPSAWPQALLDIDGRAVLVLFDIRRYEEALARLAEIAAGQGARTILLTDAWGSPIERHATLTFRAHVEAPSAWDSSLALMLLVEALVAEAQALTSDAGAERIRALEETLGRTRIFRTTGPPAG